MKKMLATLALFFAPLCAEQLAIDTHAKPNPEIVRFQIFSERCSGSSFVQKLLSNNLMGQTGKLRQTNLYGHKHFPRWFELPQEAYLGDSHKYTLEGNADTLFVILVRDPYDWLRSFNLNPHHGIKAMHKQPFSRFIRQPWQANRNEQWIAFEFETNPYIELDPLTGHPFSNVIKMRTQKIQTMLAIADRVENAYVVRYETVRDHPEEVLDEIAALFDLERKPEFNPVVYHKGTPKYGIYKPKNYGPITQKDLDHINCQLDHSLEQQLGYKIVQNAREVNNR